MNEYIKIETYCPEDYIEDLRLTVGKNNGGILGNYTYCSFVTSGKGYFMPIGESNPFIGENNQISEVNEMKIEFICKKEYMESIINSIKNVHPYEEVMIIATQLINIYD